MFVLAFRRLDSPCSDRNLLQASRVWERAVGQAVWCLSRNVTRSLWTVCDAHTVSVISQCCLSALCHLCTRQVTGKLGVMQAVVSNHTPSSACLQCGTCPSVTLAPLCPPCEREGEPWMVSPWLRVVSVMSAHAVHWPERIAWPRPSACLPCAQRSSGDLQTSSSLTLSSA